MADGPFGKIDVALRALRVKKGWTLEEAGRRAKVDPGNLSRYETGSPPTLVVLGRILTAYGTSVAELADLLEAAGQPAKEEADEEPEEAAGPEDPFVAAVAGALERLGFKRPGAAGRRARAVSPGGSGAASSGGSGALSPGPSPMRPAPTPPERERGDD